MVVVKRDDDLTIINSIHVSEKVEDEIKKLGTVKNVVRLCSNHGVCDEYWIDKYQATYYDIPEGATTEGEKLYIFYCMLVQPCFCGHCF